MHVNDNCAIFYQTRQAEFRWGGGWGQEEGRDLRQQRPRFRLQWRHSLWHRAKQAQPMLRSQRWWRRLLSQSPQKMLLTLDFWLQAHCSLSHCLSSSTYIISYPATSSNRTYIYMCVCNEKICTSLIAINLIKKLNLKYMRVM